MLTTVNLQIQEFLERSIFHSIRKKCVEGDYLPDIIQYAVNTEAGLIAFENAVDAIVTSRGFAIEVYGVSGKYEKELKKSPRIVIQQAISLPGDIGGAMDVMYDRNPSDDPLAPGRFTSYQLPPQTTNFFYDIIAVSSTAEEHRVLNQIISLALPKRGYFIATDNFGAPTDHRFFCRVTSHRNSLNDQGLREVTYLYEFPDIFEVDETILRTNIPAINEITISVDADPPTGNPINQIIT